MKFTKNILVSSFILLAFARNNTPEVNLQTPYQIAINQPLQIKLSIPSSEYAEIRTYIDNRFIQKNNPTLNIQDFPLGKHLLKVIVSQNNKPIILQKEIVFVAPKSPQIVGYEIIQKHPHDTNSFTQGLEFHNGLLYEGTGQNGNSFVKIIDLNTAKVLKQQALAPDVFGEGITIFNNKVYQLSWQNGKGFIYNADNLNFIKPFYYGKSIEGWGLTHNNTHLIKSDGTEKIWFLNPNTGKEESYIEIYTNERKINQINELEYINGKIYANVWTKNAILIINPKNGCVEKIIDLNGITNELKDPNIANNPDSVLNGIAYNPLNNKLYITGKNWDTIFEIKIIE